jgi:hypothetical protein
MLRAAAANSSSLPTGGASRMGWRVGDSMAYRINGGENAWIGRFISGQTCLVMAWRSPTYALPFFPAGPAPYSIGTVLTGQTLTLLCPVPHSQLYGILD